jgi:hypothetical protein
MWWLVGRLPQTLFIGKSQTPCCFKNVKNLPAEYAAGMAWMDSDIFQQYSTKWSNELRQKYREILLLVYNCPAHPHIQDLSNIKLIFLPLKANLCFAANGHGIIKSFKGYFRRFLVFQFD